MKQSWVTYAVFGGTLTMWMILMILSFFVPNGYYYLFKPIGIFAAVLFVGDVYVGLRFWQKKQESFDKIKQDLITAIAEGDEEKVKEKREKLSKIRAAASEVEDVRYTSSKRRYRYSRFREPNYKEFYLDAEVSSDVSDEESKEMEELLKKYMPPSKAASSTEVNLPPISLEG